jgi:hypothetical protein
MLIFLKPSFVRERPVGTKCQSQEIRRHTAFPISELQIDRLEQVNLLSDSGGLPFAISTSACCSFVTICTPLIASSTGPGQNEVNSLAFRPMRKSPLDNLLISQRPEMILGRLARVVDGLLDVTRVSLARLTIVEISADD